MTTRAMLALSAALVATIAWSADLPLSAQDTGQGAPLSTWSWLDLDYGPLDLPSESPYFVEWTACSEEERGLARSALRTAPAAGELGTTYVFAEGLECYLVLLRLLGAEEVQAWRDPANRWDQVGPDRTGWYRETREPIGYFVRWHNPDGCHATIYGRRATRPGTPHYLDGSPAFLDPC